MIVNPEDRTIPLNNHEKRILGLGNDFPSFLPIGYAGLLQDRARMYRDLAIGRITTDRMNRPYPGDDTVEDISRQDIMQSKLTITQKALGGAAATIVEDMDVYLNQPGQIEDIPPAQGSEEAC